MKPTYRAALAGAAGLIIGAGAGSEYASALRNFAT